MSKTKTRLVADFLGRVRANADTGVAEQSDLLDILGAAPEALDTINELAAAIGDDASFATTVSDSIATKVAKAGDSMTGNLSFTDNAMLQLGTNNDLELWSNGTTSHIKENGSGNLEIRASNLYVKSADNTKLTAEFLSDGGTSLYHNNTSRLTTSGDGIDVSGHVNATGGLFVNNGGHFIYSIDANTLGFRVGPNPYDYLRFGEETDGGGSLSTGAGDLKLKRADDTKLQLTTTGVTVTGDVTAANFYGSGASLTGITVGGSLTGDIDDVRVQYGTSYNGTPGQGSFFFDSLNQKLMVHTGAGFVDAVPAGSGGTSSGTETDANTTFRKYTYTLASATNAISGVAENGETLSYVTDGTQNIEVFVNGIKQMEGASNDYVATTGTSITFTYNLPATSNVDIQVYELLTNDAYYVKNEVYTKAETNTQISTGLASYLPLAGGSLSGGLIVGSNSTPRSAVLAVKGDSVLTTKSNTADTFYEYSGVDAGGMYYEIVNTHETTPSRWRWQTRVGTSTYLQNVQDPSSAGTVINELGGNFDFRVESSNATHTLFVEGSTDRIGLHQSAPENTLHIGDDGASVVNTDYGITIQRHGNGTSPGNWSNTTPAIKILDSAGQGPSSVESNTGTILLGYGRMYHTDTGAENASIINVTYDGNLGPMRLDGKGNLWTGWDRGATTLNTNSFQMIARGGIITGSDTDYSTANAAGGALFEGNVAIGTNAVATGAQLQVNDGVFTTGSEPTVVLGDTYTSWSVPYANKAQFGAYHGFEWKVGPDKNVGMTLNDGGFLILNREEATSYGAALEFQETGVTQWRIKPDADGANANELQFTNTAGTTKAKLTQDGIFSAEAFQQGTTPLGYLHQNTPMMQTPAGSQITPFNGWSVPFGTLTEEFRINSGIPWASRSAAEQELLNAMGRGNITHLVPSPIIVYRLTLPSGRPSGQYFGPYYNTKYWYDRYTTVAAFTKVLSGPGINGYWANGCTTEWKLTGSHLRGSSGGYINCHPSAIGPDSATTMLVAMPAVVEGYVNLTEPRNWWFFTNRSGGWG